MSFKNFNRVILALSIAASTFLLPLAPPAQAQAEEPIHFRQFELLSAASGWILLDDHLFWTSDAGQTWEEIGPSIPEDGTIQDVHFMDGDTGWVLWMATEPNGATSLQLDSTTDHGSTWTSRPLSLFEAGELASYLESAHMGWLDAQNGWLATKQFSSSNFSLGSLFTTSDGGNSWVRSTLPVADRVHFSDPQSGWAAGGPGGDQLFQTRDGGLIWEDAGPEDLPEEVQAFVVPPHDSGDRGLLVMMAQEMDESALKIYFQEDSVEEWSLIEQIKLDVQPGAIGLSILDAQNFVAAIPGTRSIVRMTDGQVERLENADGRSASIVELDMASLDEGWAKSVESTCSSDQAACRTTVRLLQTTDGGITWNALQLPLIQLDRISVDLAGLLSSAIETAELANLENTETVIGQGFDRCEIPTLPQMQTWSESSPYNTVNLYIGGSSRTCSNNALTSAYLFQLSQQGWNFIPTWVGPQAPCTGYLSRMSSDVTIAYQQGVDQANLAVDRLAALGLTGPSKTGSVVYYDIEHYGTIDTACRSAVNAFMNGWVAQIRARGSLAGVYGSTQCNTGLSDFMSITNVPDVIWPARWYHSLGSGFYDPDASVWNLGSCIPNSVWANHQRIRQYEGDHDETWGNLTLDIDSDVLDGVVAVPFDYPHVSRIVRIDADPNLEESVRFAVHFSKSVTGVNSGDFALTTSGISGAQILGVSGAGTSYTVTVGTGTGYGTIRLDLLDNDSIRDGTNTPLGGAGTGNGTYRYGQTYTISLPPTFSDVPISHPYFEDIEILYANGLTGGCNTSPLMFCPDDVMNRAQSAVFMLRGNFGSGYNPPETIDHLFADNWSSGTWAEKWAEAMYKANLSAGCSTSPLKFCPWEQMPREQAVIFALRLKYGMGYTPPAASGTLFADMTNTSYYATRWAEKAYLDGLIPACGTSGGKPKFCPNELVTRGLGAYMIVRAKNLTMP